MGISEILASVDREIALLKHARALLGAASAAVPPKKRGRPRKAIAAVTPEPAKPVKTKRKKDASALLKLSSAGGKSKRRLRLPFRSNSAIVPD